MLRLVIADTRPELVQVWSDVFRGVPATAVEKLDVSELREQLGIDALLMLSAFAHERYGGQPEPGVSQVLDSSRDRGPRWVVTTAPRRVHVEAIDEHTAVMVPDDPVPQDEETYESFRQAFQAISRFNQSEDQARIDTLGIHLTLINAPQGNAHREAEVVRAAYLETANDKRLS